MRAKLLVGNLLAVLLVGILSWFLVHRNASDALVTDLEPSVRRATDLVAAVRAQDGEQFTEAVETVSHRADLLAVFSVGSESDQRDAAFTVAEAITQQIAAQLPRRGRPAELVAILTAEGRVIARNSERRLDAGRNLAQEYPAVAAALATPRGRMVRDFVRYGSQGWMEVVVAPVLQGDQIRGGLMVGYTVADSAARADADRIGVHVGFLMREGDACHVQSLSAGQQREKEQLRAWCNAANLQTLLRSPRQRINLILGEEQYLAMVVPMPGVHTAGSAGAIVLASVTAARRPAGDVAFPALLVTLLGLLLVVGYNITVAQYYEKPIEQIEESLLKVLNGDRDHRINVEHPELGGIVYRINQLLAEFTEDEGSGNGSS
jgi:hypothetical protein